MFLILVDQHRQKGNDYVGNSDWATNSVNSLGYGQKKNHKNTVRLKIVQGGEFRVTELKLSQIGKNKARKYPKATFQQSKAK